MTKSRGDHIDVTHTDVGAIDEAEEVQQSHTGDDHQINL
jgi:hypothetical protein